MKVNCPINLEKCETYCNESQVFPAMRFYVEKKGKSPNAAAQQVELATEGQVTKDRARQVWRMRTPTGQTTSPPKQPKQHTKPTTKIQISEVAAEIKAGNVSDDDAKIVGDALADAINGGKAAPRVATKAVTAVKKKLGKKKKVSKLKTNFERLAKHCQMFTDGLQHWADGKMKPETKDEAIEGETVLDSAPNIIMQYSRLGIDIERILKIAQGRSLENGQNQGVRDDQIIDVGVN